MALWREYLTALVVACAAAVPAFVASIGWLRCRRSLRRERRRSEAELSCAHIALEPWRALYEEAPLARLVVDRAGVIVDSTSFARELFERREGELLGRRLAAVLRSSEALPASGDRLDVAELVRRDGAVRAVLVRTRGLPAASADPTRTCIEIIPAPQRTTPEVVAWPKAAGADPKIAEMEAMGRLAGSVAHDFNNLLTTILGHASMLAGTEEGSAGEPCSSAHEIVGTAERARGLTRQLLAFSRNLLVQARTLDVNDAIRRFRPELRGLLAANIKLGLRLDDEIECVCVDTGQLREILSQLLVNAGHAIANRGGGGAVRIETLSIDGAETGHVDGWVRIRVSDDGEGMDAPTRRAAFEPFFTTRRSGLGSGMGLAVVHGMVTQSGGRVELSSEVGRGTSASVDLPAVPRELRAAERGALETDVDRDDFAAADAARRNFESPFRPHEPQSRVREVVGNQDGVHSSRILVIDDEATVRRTMRSLILELGYDCRLADDGDSALTALAQHPYDVVICDMVMPNKDGILTCSEIHERFPEVKLIAMSGKAGGIASLSAVKRLGAVSTLNKPFSKDELLLALNLAIG